METLNGGIISQECPKRCHVETNNDGNSCVVPPLYNYRIKIRIKFIYDVGEHIYLKVSHDTFYVIHVKIWGGNEEMPFAFPSLWRPFYPYLQYARF